MSPRRAEPLALEYVLLGLIRYQPAHGYELFSLLNKEESIGLVWRIKPGRLYALLDKLEQAGWLLAQIKPGEGLQQRKEYRISETGEQAFQEWLQSPVSAAHRMRQEFMARLFFAQQEGGAAMPHLVQNQALICRSWRDHLTAEVESLTDRQVFERRVFEYRIGQVQAMLDWLESLQQASD